MATSAGPSSTTCATASVRRPRSRKSAISEEDIERYETERELQLYEEYRDVLPLFSYVVETERRFYLANKVDMNLRGGEGRDHLEIELHDAWVWDIFRPGPARFVKSVRVVTFKDVNVEELRHEE